MTAIIDYGVGNLFSLKSSLSAVGEEALVTSKEEDLNRADRLILPGVGAFRDARAALSSSGLVPCILENASKGKPLLGICLGMQLLFEKDYEDGIYEGLGLIPGEVRDIAETIEPGLKIPQIGWNALSFRNRTELFKYIKENDYVYFVHSYHATGCDSYTTSVTDYGGILTASVQRGNVYGTQFHPEKSATVGLSILKAFVEIF
ncbi:MAG: imidazole glycerol phosphate synthase subunit HisH [Spirochaetales bacterium]|nr:imidazole glycerol phosphate synthase subunit HisH [Spirochaetales bacterium]MBO6048501.1 imidazole glycerol phosphate synthase subunit HisH [Spirochaetales bacterium]MBO7349306.1 imidazole glycerol phosphate synthase subunit HisH [Spirochaetales bacterium]MBP5756744.1 imidazole glycerol phosphate synthase subunit HisH [Spirochaetales bacterium]